jgi:hypothetical protein
MLARIVVSRIFPAYDRTFIVNSAAMVALQMATAGRHFEHPIVVEVYSHLDIFVHQIPAEVIEVGLRGGPVDLLGDVAAAEAVAEVTTGLIGHFCFGLFCLYRHVAPAVGAVLGFIGGVKILRGIRLENIIQDKKQPLRLRGAGAK